MAETDHRDWSPIPWDGPDGVIVYDGVCIFCSRWVRFVIARDQARRFRFVAIQSPAGRALAGRLGIDPEVPETNAVLVDGRAFFKADAAIEVTRRLPRWGWTPAVRILPRRVRDALYDLVARNRYRLFGRTETCMVPGPAEADRIYGGEPHGG
jgi:predicted DCC family thiol-disulfide oxidoreductase YuxK